MARGHLSIQLFDGTAKGHVSELLVHVVASRAGVVSQGDSVDLNNVCVLLGDLVHAENVTCRLLHLAVLVEEVPEAGLGLHRGLREDLHAVDLRGWVICRGGLATGDLILAELGWHITLR